MSDNNTVTISLKNPRRDAPWGLFCDDSPTSIPKVWLTEVKPSMNVPRNLLTETDIIAIRNFVHLRILEAEGIEETEDNLLYQDNLWSIPLEEESTLDKEEMLELSNRMAQEDEAYNNLVKSQEQDRQEEVSAIINLPAIQCRRELKKIGKEENNFDLLKRCRDAESNKKARKTIISLINDLMVKILSTSEGRRNFQSKESLSDKYFTMIQKEDDIEIEVDDSEFKTSSE